MRRKLYKHLIETNFMNVRSVIKQFKKRKQAKTNRNEKI